MLEYKKLDYIFILMVLFLLNGHGKPLKKSLG